MLASIAIFCYNSDNEFCLVKVNKMKKIVYNLFIFISLSLLVLFSCQKQTTFTSSKQLINKYVQSLVAKDIERYLTCLSDPLKTMVEDDEDYLNNLFRHLTFVDYDYSIDTNTVQINYTFKDNDFEYPAVEVINITDDLKVSSSRFKLMEYERVYASSSNAKIAYERFTSALLDHSYQELLSYDHNLVFTIDEDVKWDQTIINSLSLISNEDNKYIVSITCSESYVETIKTGSNNYLITINNQGCHTDNGNWCVTDFSIIE